MHIGQTVKITDTVTGYAGATGIYLGKSRLGFYRVRLGYVENNTDYVALVTSCETDNTGDNHD